MDPFVLFPAIDIRDGKCVRLYQGDFAQETIYGDVVALAARYEAGGAGWIHVVDLDAARSGEALNRDTIANLIENTTAKIEVGGGIRESKLAEFYLDRGAARIVIGTAGMEDASFVEALAARYPGRIALGLDHRVVTDGDGSRREVAVRGWTASSGTLLEDAVARFSGWPIGALIVTDISRDGTLIGPDIEGYEELLASTALPIVASGGVQGPGDVSLLAKLEAGGKRLEGVIVGKALLNGNMTVEQALAACVR